LYLVHHAELKQNELRMRHRTDIEILMADALEENDN